MAPIKRWANAWRRVVEKHLGQWTRPPRPGRLRGTLTDLHRSKRELIAENALLRQQLLVLRRQVARPHCTALDRLLLILLARCAHAWKDALLVVQPETVLRWHRAGFRLVWRVTSRARSRQPKIATETIGLLRQMAAENHLWGAERIRGELLKLGIRVSKRTVQKYMRGARPPRRSGQTWATFLHNHAADVWACDFLQITDLHFRSLFAFFIVEHASRRVVHVGVTRHPTDVWVAQQLREATPYDAAPRFLLHDNDSKYGPLFARVAASSGIEILTTPPQAPRANALCERFLGSVRRECLDHVLVLGERHLLRTVTAYSRYYNEARPHQGIAQGLPRPRPVAGTSGEAGTRIVAIPLLGGLHHDYQRVA